MIYNMERVDRVIDKLIRDLGMGQDEIPYADYIEWIADGLQHIGSYYQMLEKASVITIQDFSGLLPCDFYKMVRLRDACSVNVEGYSFEQVMNNFDSRTFASIVDTVQAINFNKNLIDSTGSLTTTDYNINFNRISTSFKEGFLEVQYLAFPIDEKGWPLVPDNVSFRDALFWKCAYHISMRDPSCLKNPRMQDMEYCRMQWNKYCMQARAAANMPDLKMTERYANNWTRLFNTIDDDSDYYRSLGQKQRLNLNGIG